MWKGLLREASLFVLDTGIVYLSVLLFSIHLSLFLFIPFFPGARYSYPPLIFCVALVILYKLVHAILVRRGKSRAATLLSAVFLGFFTLWAAGSLALTSRLVFFEIAFPKILVVLAVLTGLVAAFLLFRWLKARTVPLFLVVVLSFNFVILRISRYTFEERDLLPLTLAGAQEIRKIDNPDPPDPAGQPAGMNGRILGLLNSFAGFLLASHQFGYVYAPDPGGYLYISDFSIRTDLTNIYKIRLDDRSTTASIRSEGYFRDMILTRDGKEFLATNCTRQEVCYYRSDNLETIACAGLNVPSVLNLLELPEGGVVVTSEHGFVTFLGPDRTIRKQFRPPIFCEEVVLDRTGRRLLIASMGGYTLGELDTREMKMTRRKFPAISSCGIAWDHGRNRVFLPRLLLGDVVVLDGDSLEKVARIPLAPGLRDVLYIPQRDLVVAGNYFNGKLSILDGSTYRVLRTFWVGSKNRSLTYSPERGRLYVQTVNRILELDLDQVLSPSAEHP